MVIVLNEEKWEYTTFRMTTKRFFIFSDSLWSVNPKFKLYNISIMDFVK